MIRRGYGRIINIASVWGLVGAANEVAYSTAKAGLIGFTKALAKEVGRGGIAVNTVAPGVIETDMLSGLSPEEKAALAEATATGRKAGKPGRCGGHRRLFGVTCGHVRHRTSHRGGRRHDVSCY